MKFLEISQQELQTYQKQENLRYYFSQSATYLNLAASNGLKTKILAVKDREQILAYGIFVYFQHKKVFYQVTAQYGPIMDYGNQDLVAFYFEQLASYFSKDWRVLSVRVSPFVEDRLYDDVTYREHNPVAQSTATCLEKLGYGVMAGDYYQNRTLAARCDYVKDLTDLDAKSLMKSFTGVARTCINRCAKFGVQVRDLDIFDESEAALFEEISRDTQDRTGYQMMSVAYFRQLKKAFGDKIHFKLSYIDCPRFLETAEVELAELRAKDADIKERLERGEGNPNKLTKQLKEVTFVLESLEKRTAKIKQLQAEEGDMLNLSCACFIETGQDLLYFSSAAKSKTSEFEGPYAVLHQMMLVGIERNFRYLNFLAVSQEAGEGLESASDYGVLQFKRRFNGRLESFLPSYQKRNGLGKFLLFL